jgi:hypothetical protein
MPPHNSAAGHTQPQQYAPNVTSARRGQAATWDGDIRHQLVPAGPTACAVSRCRTHSCQLSG